MSIKIIRELTKIEDNENEQVLAWARRVKAQKVKSAILENLRKQKTLTEYLQEIKHKAKTESSCKNKTECLQN